MDVDGLDTLIQSLVSEGFTARGFAMDARKEEEVVEMLDTVEKEVRTKQAIEISFCLQKSHDRWARSLSVSITSDQMLHRASSTPQRSAI